MLKAQLESMEELNNKKNEEPTELRLELPNLCKQVKDLENGKVICDAE